MVDANDFDTFLDELVHEDIVVEQPFELDTCFSFSAKYDDIFFKTIAFVSKPLPTMRSIEFHTSFHIYICNYICICNYIYIYVIIYIYINIYL